MEFIQAIALLCQLNGVAWVAKEQAKCQAWYITCVDEGSSKGFAPNTYVIFKECILKT